MDLNKRGKIGILSVLFLLLILSVNAADFDLTKQDSGIVSGLEGDKILLTVDGTNEVEMVLDRVGSSRVMATLNPGGVFIIDIGQTKELDIDKDGANDVNILVNNIIDKIVSFKLEKIGLVDDTTGDVMEDKTDDVMEDKTDADVVDTSAPTGDDNIDLGVVSQYSKWVIGAIIVVVILIIIFVMKGGDNSDKYYNKALDLHREGQEFHWDGDDETADELYEKANEFREKARNLGGGI